MDRIKILNDLQMFTSYLGFIDLTFHQYLLLGDEPMLIHTGSRENAAEMVLILKETLDGKGLSYIFVSHFESDECGGLGTVLESFPNARTICSQVTARQLAGFGISGNPLVKEPGEVLENGDIRLKFIHYPSEIHLWPGLMAFEERRGLLFSSDLFINRGPLREPVVHSTMETEIGKMSIAQIPNPDALRSLQDEIREMPVKVLVPGHGPCIKIS